MERNGKAEIFVVIESQSKDSEDSVQAMRGFSKGRIVRQGREKRLGCGVDGDRKSLSSR